MILVQGLVQAPLLGAVEQRRLRRVQVQQPMVALHPRQGTIGGDVGSHAGQSQPLEKLQWPLRLLGGASGLLILVIFGVWLWRGLSQM